MVNRETKSIFSNMVWMTFDKVFLLLLNLLVTVRVANYYGSLDYGNYQYAVSIVAVLEILVTFVDGRVVKKRYIDSNPDLLVFNATICRVIFSAIAIIVGLIYICFSNRGLQFKMMFLILLLNAILVNLRFGMANRFEYLLKSKKTVIAADIAALLGSLLQLGAVAMSMSIVAISVIQVISSAINLIILIIQYKAEFKNSTRKYIDPSLVGGMIKESLPLAIASSCATIYTRCDSIMIGSLMTTAEVGVYSIAVKIISIVQIAIAPIRESVYPKLIQLYSTDKIKYERKYVQITSALTWIYILGVLLSFVVLPVAFNFLSDDYAEAYPVYRVYVLGTFFMYNAALRAGHFTLINKGKILTYTQLISVVMNIILNYFLINLFGLYGAAAATVITQAASLMFSNLFFGATGRKVFWWQIKALNPIRIFEDIKVKR